MIHSLGEVTGGREREVVGWPLHAVSPLALGMRTHTLSGTHTLLSRSVRVSLVAMLLASDASVYGWGRAITSWLNLRSTDLASR